MAVFYDYLLNKLRVQDLTTSVADARYLKLDCSNDPLTGDLSHAAYKSLYGATNQYSVEFDGSDAVHTLTSGSFVFTGGSLSVKKASPNITVENTGATGQANAYFKATQTTDETLSQLLFYNDGDSVAMIRVKRDGYNDQASFELGTQKHGVAGVSPILKITGDGSVGIGEASPSDLLHVTGTGTVRIRVESTTGGAAFRMVSDEGDYGFAASGNSDLFQIYDYTDSRSIMQMDGDGVVSLPNDSQPLVFGAGSDYSIQWNGSDAVHTISAGDFVFTGGNVGVSTSSPICSSGGLDISNGSIGLVVGADGNALTRTDSTQKYGRMGCPHYLNAEQPVAVFLAGSGSGLNALNIGGGSSYFNACTQASFYLAQNTITTTGTLRARLEYNTFVLSSGVELFLRGDNQKLYFGAGDDASITYDGTDLCVNTKEVGAGTLKINGVAAWSGTFTNGDGATVTVTDGIITSVA